MVEKLKNIINITGFIGSIISIGGAVISVKGSRSAKKFLKEINIKESAIEIKEFKEGLDNLYTDIRKDMLAKNTNRKLDVEIKKYNEWFEKVGDLTMDLPNKFKETEVKLEEIRMILKDHVYKEKSLHETQKGSETMFHYLEGVIYVLNKNAKRESN